jgi:hypothetical protein
MKPILLRVEELPLQLQRGVTRYLKRNPRISALATKLRFTRHWTAGNGAGMRAFGKTPLAAMKNFATEYLRRKL